MGTDRTLTLVEMSVRVEVDSSDAELQERLREDAGLSIADVVCSEVRSNLESVSYTREVLVNPKDERR